MFMCLYSILDISGAKKKKEEKKKHKKDYVAKVDQTSIAESHESLCSL